MNRTDLGFSKIVTIRESAKPQAIPGRDDHVAYIYLSGMALGESKEILIHEEHNETRRKPTFVSLCDPWWINIFPHWH
jgi:hypothetical protein